MPKPEPYSIGDYIRPKKSYSSGRGTALSNKRTYQIVALFKDIPRYVISDSMNQGYDYIVHAPDDYFMSQVDGTPLAEYLKCRPWGAVHEMFDLVISKNDIGYYISQCKPIRRSS